jgi:hypothetical protein
MADDDATTDSTSDTPSDADTPAGSNGVQVTYPDVPTNSKQSGPLHVNNTNNDSGSVFLTGDLVTFEVENDRGDEVTCDFELQDDQQPGVVLARGSLAWAAGEIGTKYIQFQGFPPRFADQSAMESCNYTMTLTNHPDPNEGTEVWENIY